MPYIDIKVSKCLNDTSKENLQKEIADNISIIPGKKPANTTICICDCCTFYREYEKIEAAFIEVRLYKESPLENKTEFAKKMFSIIENTLSIPPSKTQINFLEMPMWASNGEVF